MSELMGIERVLGCGEGGVGAVVCGGSVGLALWGLRAGVICLPVGSRDRLRVGLLAGMVVR